LLLAVVQAVALTIELAKTAVPAVQVQVPQVVVLLVAAVAFLPWVMQAAEVQLIPLAAAVVVQVQ
jgi:hypothetical protein